MERTSRSRLIGSHDGIYSSRYPLGATSLLPSIRAGRAFRRDPLAFLLKLQDPRPVFRFKAGFSEFALVNEPELIRRVLVDENRRFGEGKWTQRGHYVMGDCLITREGARHRERRAMTQAGFTHARIRAAAPQMVASAEQLESRWVDGEIVSIQREMAHAALTASSQTLFEVDPEPDADEISAALAVMLRAISRLPLPWPSLLAARRLLERTARSMMQGPIVDELKRAGACERAVIDEIISLLIASVDTTPGTLAWLWYEVGRHPEIESQLQRELTEVLSGRTVTGEDVPKLSYLGRVLSETLRLHPPVHFIDRRALEDIDLGGTQLRAGDYVLLSPLFTQRDPRFYDDPDAFRPDRWEHSAAERAERFAYFPFGAGPHVCIGMGLAVQEMTLIVAVLAQRWRLRPILTTVRGNYASGMRMRLEKRG